MNACSEELILTSEERELAREHWQALMFAFTRFELETARLALMEAPFPVQHAVIADINARWLEGHEASKEDNPFLPVRSATESVPGARETEVNALQQVQSSTVHPSVSNLLSSLARRIQQPLVPNSHSLTFNHLFHRQQIHHQAK